MRSRKFIFFCFTKYNKIFPIFGSWLFKIHASNLAWGVQSDNFGLKALLILKFCI